MNARINPGHIGAAPREAQHMALAAIFQAAELANQVAIGNVEHIDQHAFETSIQSIFVFLPNGIQDIYPSFRGLATGIDFLTSTFPQKSAYPQKNKIKNPQDLKNRHMTLRYALGLINLEKILAKKPDVLTHLKNILTQCERQFELLNNQVDTIILHRLAQAYIDTLGQFKPRIIIHGQSETLQKASNTNRIRSLLLAGIRAAMLWHQLGGRSWHLILRKRKILNQIHQFRSAI